MAKVVLSREIDFSSFGLPEWTESQYQVPLVLHVSNAKARLFVHKSRHPYRGKSGKTLDVFPQGRIEMEFDPAPARLLQGLTTKGKSAEAAEIVFEVYRVAMERFEGLLLSTANLRYLFLTRVMREAEFFGTNGLSRGGVTWSIDGAQAKPFEPKLPATRGINPMFKSDQLMTFHKWGKLQEAADNNVFPEGQLLELYRLRTKAHSQDTRTAAIEASIISETLLREYGIATLTTQGFSANKIKKIKDELTFNNLLNVVLPLSMSKSEFSKISSAVNRVDTLRRLRNDIVHGELDMKSVDPAIVQEGTEGAIRLVSFLKAKLGK